eukprot:1137353-Pyramimonas_sp.AAC.1
MWFLRLLTGAVTVEWRLPARATSRVQGQAGHGCCSMAIALRGGLPVGGRTCSIRAESSVFVAQRGTARAECAAKGLWHRQPL